MPSMRGNPISNCERKLDVEPSPENIEDSSDEASREESEVLETMINTQAQNWGAPINLP